MKNVFFVLALALTGSAFSAENNVSFGHSGYEGWGMSYFSCDYVEAQTEKVLELFGATDVSVRCSGGIEFGSMWPVSVTATFNSPVLSGREVAEVVKLKGDNSNPSCGLNVKIVKSLLPSFNNVSVIKKNDSCAFQSSNYSYEFAIVR
jgi:hypothetical protein